MFEKYSAYLTEFCSVNRTMATSTSENWDLTGTLGDLEALTALGWRFSHLISDHNQLFVHTHLNFSSMHWDILRIQSQLQF